MKKYITAGIILIFCLLTGVILWLVFMPRYKMPVVPFAYHDKHGFIYIFASSGDIYRIEPKDYGSHPYAFQTDAMTALENGRTEVWLKHHGKISVSELKEQYRAFRKITDSGDFNVSPIDEAVPDVVPNDNYMTPSEMWYGFSDNHESRTIFLRGYRGYKATDERIEKVASWIQKRVEAATSRRELHPSR